MPEIDGFQLAEQIQQQGLLAGGAMIMLSSAGNLTDVARCQKLGIVRCLIKPAKQSDLRDAILRALGAGGLDPLRLARLCQEAENHVVGAPCGVMDQIAVAMGTPGRILPILCRPASVQPALVLPPGVEVVGWPGRWVVRA